jgi:hypothetical protein
MFYARKKLAELVKDSNIKSTEQVTKRVLNCDASRGIRSPCAELAAQYSYSTPTPTAVRPSLPASPLNLHSAGDVVIDGGASHSPGKTNSPTRCEPTT